MFSNQRRWALAAGLVGMLLAPLGVAAQDRLTLNDGRVLVRQFEPTLAAGRAVRVWSFRDVTLEDRALQALRESEARLREAQRLAQAC